MDDKDQTNLTESQNSNAGGKNNKKNRRKTNKAKKNEGANDLKEEEKQAISTEASE